MDKRIQDLLQSELKDTDYPNFSPGDSIRVHTREEIGGQMRQRTFEGVCIAERGKGPNRTFKVRKTSFGVGIERIFPLYSDLVVNIEIVRKGKVRRAKLNYLEGRSQRDSRIKEQRFEAQEETGDLESSRVENQSTEEQSMDTSDEARDADSSEEESGASEEQESIEQTETDSEKPGSESIEESEDPTNEVDDQTNPEEQEDVPETKEGVGESV